ncbi:MAG: XisI protein [Armatimonadetes bacterium]|nr:XisI protein [Armatimonadota bacterium]
MEPNTLSEAVTPPNPLRGLAQNALRRIVDTERSGVETVRTHAVFDHDADHYLLVAEGWQGYRRVYRTLAHVALIGDCLHIYEDGTVEGVAAHLYAAGVAPESIVCEWTTLPPPA